MELEEKVKKLEKEFPGLSKLLIKRTLCDDDVREDLTEARQKLQKFTKGPFLINPAAAADDKELEGNRYSPHLDGLSNIRNTLCEEGDAPKTKNSFRDSLDGSVVRGGSATGNRPTPFQLPNTEERALNGRQAGFVTELSNLVSTGLKIAGPPKYLASENSEIPRKRSVIDSNTKLGGIQEKTNAKQVPDPPKPKPKPNWRKQRDFQESAHYLEAEDHSHFTPRQLNERDRGSKDSHGRQVLPVSLREIGSRETSAPSSFDDSDREKVRQNEPSRRGQGDRGRTRNRGSHRGRGQTGIRRAESISGVTGEGPADNVKDEDGRSQFERNKLLVRGLAEETSQDGLLNFIEAKSSGQEVEDVQILKNGNALVIMADDIKDFRKIKTKCEERGLDGAQVSIEQVPVCKSILVTGFSENVTHDFIELYFESRRNGGGPVEKVHYRPKSGRAVVVFQDAKDMEKVITRHEEKPHVLQQTQVSIKVYQEFLEGEDADLADGSGDLGACATGASEARVSKKPDAKTQQLHIAVDPDVMEYVNSTGFQAELNNSLAVKKSEITWKPNSKMAVIVYRGEDDSDSWQSERIDQVQSYLGKFAKCDVQVTKDFWEAVVANVPSIRACLGVDPPLVKAISDSNVARIVSLGTDVKSNEEKVKSKLEEIYREETRKTYLKKKIPNVPEERLILLKKIKFAEKLQEKNKELEIKFDTEAEEIYFEGPRPQFTEATMKFYKQMADMVEKKLTLSVSILEILNTDEGLQTVKRELERNNVEAVFVIEKDATIVGSSAAHADNAARLVNKLMLEEKVQVDEKSKHLLKSAEWLKLCDEMNQTAVRVHRNNWSDTYVAGFKDDVTEVIKKFNTFLENNCIREESFVCASDIERRYLLELRQDDLRAIQDQLKDFVVNIKKGKDDDDFVISGNREGLKRVKKEIGALINATESKTFEVKQPGLRKYFDSGKGDRLVKSVEKDQDCAIKVQENLGRGRRDEELRLESVSDGSTSSVDSEDDAEDDQATAFGTDASTLVIAQRHKVSWKPGNIEAEKADVLVSSQGACDQAIIKAGGPQAATPNVGDITVSGGFSSVSHVIHTNCCKWNNGGGEPTLRAIVQKCLQTGETLGANSIAFPVIGTGNLHFPRDTASRIMLDETVNFCRTNPASNLRDIRFVVFNQDQTLTAAFKQEMDKLQPQLTGHSAIASVAKGIRSFF
ncbi:poly [ADP-ribose] polymerase 14-like [Stylophora pistillata]|uniref:poly [ADP-ribose] polymerase 14-like n=1 Tax=Stylophora pistillata TaxID=50429 RepID=UPI000C0488F5|nr:poly [ADP-ribose] polymerase 14-like [Stylophora pistillata]